MKFGFIPIEGGKFYKEFVEEALLGESLGFDSLWLEEHHGVENHYWPSPMIGLAGIATRTENILLGTNIMVLPFYHPVRVAEDTAMLDIISRGRFILGVAIGYKPDEFQLYQIPMEKRGERFEEALRLIKDLWTQETVNFEGKYFKVNGVKIEPRPISRPHPPLWLGGWGDLSLSRAASIGDAWIPGPTANLEKLLAAQQIYKKQLRAAGVDPASRPTPLTRDAVIARTDEEAKEVAEKYLLVAYRDEYGGGAWQHPLIGKEDTTSTSDLDAITKDRFLIGSAKTIINQIKRFRDLFGADHLIFRLYFPSLPHEFIMSELNLLAKEVIPAFKG